MENTNDISSDPSSQSHRKRTLYEMIFKRILDIFFALLLIILLSPILLILSILTRIKHGKPIIFAQRRVGHNRKIFWFYKFRSMSNARDKDGNLLPDRDRITKFGKFIRKTSLDELPQLWNILKGDMSFIGPRPKDVKESVFFTKQQCVRFEARPGISGLAQVNGRNAINFEQIAEYDAKYIERITFWNDVKILFKTFIVVFRSKNIDGNAHNSNHVCGYYNDLLLQRGDITLDQYENRVSFSNTLNVGDIMPPFDESSTQETKTKEKAG